MKGQESRALAGLNIRQFKFINEIFGRNQADSLLCHVKDVLEYSMEEGEYFCRNSADMFLMLFKNSDKEIIRERIRKIMGEIAAFSANWRRNYEIQMYCGVSLIPQGERKQIRLPCRLPILCLRWKRPGLCQGTVSGFMTRICIRRKSFRIMWNPV